MLGCSLSGCVNGIIAGAFIAFTGADVIESFKSCEETVFVWVQANMALKWLSLLLIYFLKEWSYAKYRQWPFEGLLSYYSWKCI